VFHFLADHGSQANRSVKLTLFLNSTNITLLHSTMKYVWVFIQIGEKFEEG